MDPERRAKSRVLILNKAAVLELYLQTFDALRIRGGDDALGVDKITDAVTAQIGRTAGTGNQSVVDHELTPDMLRHLGPMGECL